MENLNYRNLIPSLGGSYSFGWRKMFEKAFLPLLLAVIIVGILNGPSGGAKWELDGNDGFSFPMLLVFPLVIFGLAYTLLFLPVIKYGRDLLFLNAMRDQETEIRLLFEGFKTKYLNIVLANLIVFALIMLGIVMLIVPGIIIACRLVFVSYLVMDKELEPMKAVEKSWQMTRGHGWTIFGMAILAFFIIIVGLIVFFVGVIVSFIWIHSAFASLYLAVLNEKDDDNPIPILGVNEF